MVPIARKEPGTKRAECLLLGRKSHIPETSVLI